MNIFTKQIPNSLAIIMVVSLTALAITIITCSTQLSLARIQQQMLHEWKTDHPSFHFAPLPEPEQPDHL